MYCHSESEIMSVSDRNSKRNMGMRNEYAHNYPQTSKIIVKEKLQKTISNQYLPRQLPPWGLS